MKKISKVLCLVLVLAMMAGLCCFGTSAAFADADKITYKEAAAVMEATKIMVGDDAGFRPTDGLTRAEACVMIAKLCDAASIKGTCSFKDVKGHWAEQYVAYCAAEGYVSGYSATKFGPDDALTGSAWALMLLRVLGYDPACEGIGGDTWEIGVAKLVKALDLAKVVKDFDGTAKITREEAAQLALNTLQSTCVKYADKGTTIKINGAEITTNGKDAEAVTTAAGAGYDNVNDSKLQLAEKLFKDNLTLAATGNTDDFGRPCTKWTYKGKPAAEGVSEPVVVYTAFMDTVPGKKQIAADLKGYKFAGTELKTKDTVYAGDGDANYNESVTLDELTLTEKTGAAATDATNIVNAIADLTANGKVVEIYANNKKNVTAVNTITYAVEKITAVTTNKDGDVTYNLSASGAKIDYADDYANDDTIVLHGSFAKNDYVTTVVGVNSADTHVYPTTKVVGTQTANDASKLTISGSTYTLGLGVTNVSAANFPNSDKDANYFVEQYGFVVACSDVEETLVYGVVNKIAGKNETTGLNTGKSVEAELVLADATKTTVKVSKINGLKVKDGAFTVTTNGTTDSMTVASNVASAVSVDSTATNNDNLSGKIVTYKVDSDGKYELTYVAYTTDNKVTATSGDKLTNKGVPAMGGVAGTTTTVYVVKTTNGNGDEVFKAYTGYANVPTVEANGGTLYARYALKDTKVVFVYIDAATNSDVGESTVNNIFRAHSTTITTVGTGSDVYYTMNGILDGKAVDIKTKTANFALVDGTNTMSADTFYKLTINENGYVTAATVTTGLVASSAPVDAAFIEAIEDGSFGGYLFNDKTQVFVINGASVSEGSVESIAIGDTWEILLPSTGTAAEQNTIKTLYILVAP